MNDTKKINTEQIKPILDLAKEIWDNQPEIGKEFSPKEYPDAYKSGTIDRMTFYVYHIFRNKIIEKDGEKLAKVIHEGIRVKISANFFCCDYVDINDWSGAEEKIKNLFAKIKSACKHQNLDFIKNLGRCYNLYKCMDCGRQIPIDSSD